MTAAEAVEILEERDGKIRAWLAEHVCGPMFERWLKEQKEAGNVRGESNG